VRGGVGDPLAQKLSTWLAEGVEANHRARTELGPAPVTFLYREAGSPRALLGVLRGSRDKVGRAFPLAVFAPAAGPEVEQDFPSVGFVWRAFLDAAAAALAADVVSPAELAARVAALPLPGAAELASVEAARARAAGAPASGLLAALGEPGRAAYAFSTFLAACEPARGREPAHAEVVLECPAAGEPHPWAWLELARLALGWRAAPPFLLTSAAPARLYLSLGALPAALLPALGAPPRESRKVWPLETANARAIEAARGALGPARLAALERGGEPLGDLLRALVPPR
jgi:type VI secretion system protein ImpM